MSAEGSEIASTSNDIAYDKEESQLQLCQRLLRRRLELSRSDPNSKDPAIVSAKKEVSVQLSNLICGQDGVKTTFVAIDQIGDPSFWNTAIACYSLSTIILNVPQKSVFSVVTEIRKLMLNELWGNKLSLLLASLIEVSERISTGKVATAADVVFVDFILRPFQRMWEGILNFLLPSSSNGHWSVFLDSSIWIACCWLRHSSKMRQLKVHSRLDKLFSVCMIMNGRLCTLTKDQQVILKNLKKAFTDIITGIVGSSNYVDQEKSAGFFVQNFVTIVESSLPDFNFSVASQQLIEVAGEEQKPKNLVFKQVNLKVAPIQEVTTNLDAYINSLLEIFTTLDAKDKSKLLINLWSECVRNWISYKQETKWSLSSSKWSSVCSSVGGTNQNIEKRRFVVEYFMSALESLLDSIGDDLDQVSTLKLADLSKDLISTSINEVADEFARIQSLDLNTGLDSTIEIRAKTLHLAIGLSGFIIFQSDKVPNELRGTLNEITQLLHSLLDLIEKNKHLPIGELQVVADSAQQILSLSNQFLLDGGGGSSLKNPPVVAKKERAGEFAECLRIAETDYSNETDGSVEIAERGHAIISMERRFHDRRQLDLDAVDGGMLRVFDVLANNLRHPDSYVYLSSINALCELSSWHHKTCLPKMMFLLKTWDNEKDGDSDDEGENGTYPHPDSVPDESSKQNDNWNRIRCQTQMGESIAKVVIGLGDLAPSYFDKLSQFFLTNAQHEDHIASASALSGLASLILACRGRYFTKIIHELMFCCESKLKLTGDPLVRRSAIHLLRSIVTSCQIGVFTDLKDSSSKITSMLRRIRAYDPDPTVRLHADLALLEAETVLNEMFSESLNLRTRVVVE